MVTRKKTGATEDGAGSILSTVSGPSNAQPPASLGSGDPIAAQLLIKTVAGQQLAAAMRFNPNKPAEYGDAARTPPPGATAEPSTPAATGSTSTETIASAKLGAGVPPQGANPTVGPLDRVRVDGGGQRLTTNQGVPIADNQHSLKIGLRGPTAMEDFILREKLTHFDHERIPERVVHARGSAAHGYFESYQDLSAVTRASLFAQPGKRTPVFTRFSTVAGERGSSDTVRDVRGFAVKFYTDEGNWDLVGNNMPVFFIQDAMKFPDLVHAVKPEPHHAMPQASSAHDTFWDFVSLMPESTHMLLWQMSDRAIPRSYRTMQGFGVHTFRLVNAAGESVFCKFHWTPLQGTHSLVWDEAAKLVGADPDFHRRDLWEAIDSGNFPEWELALQIFTEEQAESFAFDVLDPTKLVPEELVPLTPVGKMVLNRNPDNFFAETEQVAFCTAHIVPGIDFSNDPLLQGRIHSYLDTQISRLGGPNFHEIPVNSPVVQVQNNQREGMHRQAIHRGRVNYEPNSLAGGCPFQAGMKSGFTSFPQTISEDKVRGNPELFADHYSQARLFFNSQSPVEQAHIAAAFRFELTRVQTPAVRERVLATLANVNPVLAGAVAGGLGMEVPAPLPLATSRPMHEYEPSPALSLLSRPGETGIRTRKVALLVANGVDGAMVRAIYSSLLEDGAVPRVVASQLGKVTTSDGATLDVEITLEAGPSVLYDAVVVPDGDAVTVLSRDAHALDFVREQYRHCKPILVVGAGAALLKKACVPPALPDGSADPALIGTEAGALAPALAAFKTALAAHRSFARETDPPGV
ncbi:catalase [Massilia antarctica]|uniref:catalase n=1 Tax=Massilia antarctica TaxID=2765360 RepID=UPI0006BB5CA6|nr:catalase [Massilia sp. H27-R4]MCY0911139.1 catalase [Massilia sp. H27-R4]CUI05277.1 Catalase [Janthinobacterium sp. CG23_2]CUU29063.1 Catalase [Janthinobacterium sp. CG23_2]